MPPPPPEPAPTLLDELRSTWWIYMVVPVVLTALSMQGWGANEELWASLAVNGCATLCIGLCSQLAFFVAERRGWSLPWGLQNPLLLLLGVAVGTELTLALLGSFASFDPQSLRLELWIIGGMVAAVVATVSIVYERLRARARAVELREEQARRQALQAQLDALQSRMNPHFLFNCLNTVAALIEEDPRAAVEAVERLSELLRYTLERSGERLVPLADELRCARGYLELEAVRFGERLQLCWAVDADLESLRVPPLTIQPLVENAVKHGVARSRGPVKVEIRVRREAGALHVEVCDDGPGPGRTRGGKAAGTGSAQSTLRERLRLIYGEAARFEAGPQAARGYRAQLALPQELNP